jgi:hypothetical protein
MKFGPQFLFLLLVTVATITLACGSSPQLKSVSVSPASANASDYPNGQVQFTAVGYYAGSSSPVSVSPEWTACPPINAVTVSKTGVAQCEPGAAGTYSGPYYVEAFVPVSSLDCGPPPFPCKRAPARADRNAEESRAWQRLRVRKASRS